MGDQVREVSISAVVPVFNSQETLVSLVSRLLSVLDQNGREVEIILVNDGSRDGSWDTIVELARLHPQVRGINLMRNHGQHNALLCGVRAARHEVIVTLDDDLQNPPEEIPGLLARLADGFDVVYGTPRRESHGLVRNLASQMTKIALQDAMGAAVARDISAFRVFRTQVRDGFAGYRGAYVSLDVLLTWGTTRFAAIEVQHDERKHGKSNYTLPKLLAHALNMMTGFSVVPLRLASLIGFGFTLFGLLVLCYVLGRYLLQGGSVPGFPFLASIIAIFSGANLFCLGIVGEYLARVHFRVMDRPAYVIRERTERITEDDTGARALPTA